MGRRPNFLFFMTDQHRADYLACMGHKVLRTPNIDGIAESGTLFRRFYVATSQCMPNRASLLTGRFPSAHGLRHNGCHLSYSAATFVDVLREGGYRTIHVGKSHVQPMTNSPPPPITPPATTFGPIDEAWKGDGGDYTQELPQRYHGHGLHRVPTPYYGYDHVDMVTEHGDQAGGHYLQWLRSTDPRADTWRDRKNQLPHQYSCPQAVRTPIPEQLYSTSYIRDRTIERLNEATCDERPFFAFISFPDPHHPFSPPGRYWDMYDPSQFEVPRPWSLHRNPVPPMRNLHGKFLDGTQNTLTQEAFMADDQQTREAMALTCGMISMIDDAVGSVLDALKSSGRYDDTVIIFNSDHGDYLGDYGLMLKGALQLDSVLRVPFIWSDPDDRNGRVSDSLCSTVDLGTTIIERAGLKPYWGLQGKSLLPALNKKAIRNRLLIEYQAHTALMGFTAPATVRTLIEDGWRLSVYRGEEWGELYDREADPDESFNLWNSPQHYDQRLKLTNALVEEMAAAVDQSPRALRRA